MGPESKGRIEQCVDARQHDVLIPDGSNEIAANWLREHAADIPASTPQITEGEVLVTTSG